jgi:hypothetical protein
MAMSRSFNSQQQINNTFATVKTNLYASDYIANKKAKAIFCNATATSLPTKSSISVSNNKQINSQENLKLFNNASILKQQDSSYCTLYPFNTANLNINLYTTTDLSNVQVLQFVPTGADPTTIDSTGIYYPLYEFYTLDPCGSLFGNTECYKRNFLNYWVPNNPTNCPEITLSDIATTTNYLNWTLKDNVVILECQTLTIPSGNTLVNSLFTITNDGTITNNGTLYNYTSGTITNNGTINNVGTLYNYTSGTITNNGTFNNPTNLYNADGTSTCGSGTISGITGYLVGCPP